MNVFLLMVALAGPVEAPKPVMLVPPALVTAAVPSVRIAPEGNSAAESAAPEAGLQGGDAVDAAVAQAQAAPEGIETAESAAPEAQLPSGGSVNEAVARAQAFPESSAAQSAEPGECRIGSASQVEDAGTEAAKVAASAVDSSADAAADVRTLPRPQSDESCTLVGTYAKKRPLSGPWSALRRLEAARIRGDSAEAKRVEPMLGDLLDKAIFGEPD